MFFKLPSIIATLSLFALGALAVPAPGAFPTSGSDYVTFDGTYDNAAYSLNGVACSNGANGLITKGFSTLGDLPTFPHIGGSHAVAAWNSPNCGSCWELEYGGTKINVLAVDTAGVGFNIAWRAMMDLAGPTGVSAGKVLVNYKQVPASVCGL